LKHRLHEAEAGRSATYAGAGVNIKKGRRAVELIRDHVRTTFRPEVVGDIGGFAGAFALDEDRLLISSTDGVGTKVIIAQMLGRHSTIGIDLVAMSVNDVAAQGAEPLFFLDYIVTDHVEPTLIEQIVGGIVKGCREAGCALLGGEIAEHPGHLLSDSYDLAGFCVGMVSSDKFLTGASIEAGDILIGLSSSGLHSNGFSLARHVLLEGAGMDLESTPEGLDRCLGDELLTPTLIYSPVTRELNHHGLVKGLSHITGGGIPENLARILPEGTAAVVDSSTWDRPPIFDLIAAQGSIDSEEMITTFNMGIGMIAVVAAEAANRVLDLIRAKGFHAQQIGVTTVQKDGPPITIL